MENIAIAFLDIAALAHEWADDIAAESGRDYDAIRARFGDRNKYFRMALEELSSSLADDTPVPAGFEIEF